MARVHRATPRFTAGTTRFGAYSIRFVDAPSLLSAWESIFVNRSYEVADLPAKPTLVDIGANIGLAALWWRIHVGDFRYVGFEPDPTAAATCRENLRAWNVDGQLYECAVTADGSETLFEPDRADGGRTVTHSLGRSVIRVPAVRASSVLGGRIDLLKIDIEGAELNVLREAASMLANVRNVFVEYHWKCGTKPFLGEILSLLESTGFVCLVQPSLIPTHAFRAEWRRLPGFVQLVNIFATRQESLPSQ